jgi:hypothetical protein
MQGALSSVTGGAEIDVTSASVAPTVRGHLDLQSSVRFLDNSSSNWEWLLSPWSVSLKYTHSFPHFDGPLASPAQQFVSLTSSQHAIVHFNPACLLMLGDVMSFVTTLFGEEDIVPAQGGVEVGGPDGITEAAVGARRHRVSPPSMAEQMALGIELTERLPQRYCIQNHLGVRLWYWPPQDAEGALQPQRHELGAQQSQQLRCKPPVKSFVMEASDGVKARSCCLCDVCVMLCDVCVPRSLCIQKHCNRLRRLRMCHFEK